MWNEIDVMQSSSHAAPPFKTNIIYHFEVGENVRSKRCWLFIYIYKRKQAPMLQQGTKQHKRSPGWSGVSQYLTCGNYDLILLFLGTWVAPSNLEKTIMTANSKVREHQSPSNWEPTIQDLVRGWKFQGRLKKVHQ